MAKNLFIIRHAKADAGMPDFDRHLHPKGVREAMEMADKLAQYDPRPHHLVSSPAKRALGTAQIFSDALQIPRVEIELDRRIYDDDIHTLLQIVRNFDDQYDHIAIFGHNPDIGALASHLGDSSIDRFPTCAVTHLQFMEAGRWNEIKARGGKVRLFIYP